MLSGAAVDADKLLCLSLTGVKLGPLGAGHDGSHAGLRGHPGHRVDLESDNQYEYRDEKILISVKCIMWMQILLDQFYIHGAKGVL